MSLHTDQSFWPALRRIVPNLPEDGVTKCVITVTPCDGVKVDMTMYAQDAAGKPVLQGIDGDLGYAIETRRFRIVPDEDPT